MIYDRDGKQVQQGSRITDFRGEEHVFKRVESKPSPGKSGKVQTDRGTFYFTVFDLTTDEKGA